MPKTTSIIIMLTEHTKFHLAVQHGPCVKFCLYNNIGLQFIVFLYVYLQEYTMYQISILVKVQDGSGWTMYSAQGVREH